MGVAIMLVVLTVMVVLGVGVGAEVTKRSRVQTAADAAALAGVNGDRRGAEVVAKQNGALLRSFGLRDGVVTVEVSVDGYQASASAQRTNDAWSLSAK